MKYYAMGERNSVLTHVGATRDKPTMFHCQRPTAAKFARDLSSHNGQVAVQHDSIFGNVDITLDILFLANVNSSSCSLYFVVRPSVCLSVVCRLSSVVCLSVTFVRPTQAIEIFGTFSSPFGTLAICWHTGKILRRSSHGNPSVGGVKHNRGSRI